MAKNWTNVLVTPATVLGNYQVYESNVVALYRPNVDSAVSNIDSSSVVNAEMIGWNWNVVTSSHDSFDLELKTNS